QARRQLRALRQQRQRRRRGPVEGRRLAGELAIGARRDEPLSGADHLPRDQRLARLATGVEGHVAQAREEEQQARDEQQGRRLHGRSALLPARSLSLAGRAVSVARSWRNRSRSTTTHAGAIAISMPSATSAAATGASAGGSTCGSPNVRSRGHSPALPPGESCSTLPAALASCPPSFAGRDSA